MIQEGDLNPYKVPWSQKAAVAVRAQAISVPPPALLRSVASFLVSQINLNFISQSIRLVGNNVASLQHGMNIIRGCTICRKRIQYFASTVQPLSNVRQFRMTGNTDKAFTETGFNNWFQ